MIDLSRVPEELRAALADIAPETLDYLRACVADYSALCDQINERLLQCRDLLNRGLRSEAIQKCELEPNLLDSVNLLDVPELTERRDVLAQHGIVAPSRLQLEIAAALNSAYAIEQPLKALLKEHRLRALARTPLDKRIETLRKIHVLDRTNPVWQEDLRNLERERFKEIRSEAEHAGEGNFATLERLISELRDPGLSESPPAEVLGRVEILHQQSRRAVARENLSALEPLLSRACRDLDLAKGRRLRSQWVELAGIAELRDQEDIAKRVTPALKWLARQDKQEASQQEFARDVEDFRSSLPRIRPAAELERRYVLLQSHGYELDESLKEMYSARIARLQKAEVRNRRMAIGVGIALSLLIVAGTGWMVRSRLVAREARKAVAVIEQQLASDQWDAADQFIKELERDEPAVAQHPLIREARERVSDLQAKEKQRREEFAEAIERAIAHGPDMPDRVAMQKADELARTDSEKEALSNFQILVRAADKKRQNERDVQFKATIDGLARSIGDMESDRPAELRNKANRLKGSRNKLDELERQQEDMSQPIRNELAILSERLARIERATRDAEIEQAAIDELTDSLGNLRHYRQAIEEYIGAFPRTSLATSLKQVLGEEQALWARMTSWNAMLERWPAPNELRRLAPSDAKSLGKIIGEFLTEAKSDHDSMTMRAENRLLFVQAVSMRGGTAPELKKMFSDPLVVDRWMVETNDGKRYYTVGKPRIPTPVPKDLTIQAAISFNDDIKRVHITTANIVQKQDQLYSAAPHSIVAADCRDLLAGLNDTNWEETFCRVVTRIHDEPRMDSVLKVLFLQKVLATACKGSSPMAKEFARHLEALSDAALDTTVPWMNPDDEAANRMRALADGALGPKRFPSLSRAQQDTVRRRDMLCDTFGEPFRLVGWLKRDDTFHWQCPVTSIPTDGVQLWVAYCGGQREGVHYEQIGQIVARAVRLDSARQVVFREGRPVFALTGDPHKRVPE